MGVQFIEKRSVNLILFFRERFDLINVRVSVKDRRLKWTPDLGPRIAEVKV
jgi:hypothetical protein